MWRLKDAEMLGVRGAPTFSTRAEAYDWKRRQLGLTPRSQLPRVSRGERAQAMNAERNTKVLDAAAAIALEEGLQRLSRSKVAARAGVSLGGVSASFGGMGNLTDAVVRAAIDRPILPVLAQALAVGHPLAKDAPADLKQQALDAVS